MKNRLPSATQLPAEHHKNAGNGGFLANCYRLITELIEPGLTNAGYYSYMTVAAFGAPLNKSNPFTEFNRETSLFQTDPGSLGRRYSCL
jgi:hypothetical protein